MPGLYRVTVFDAGGNRPRLEWETPDGQHRQRTLDRAELTKLIESAEHEYAADHPNLVDLGSQVSRWIDGPADRWLAAALEQQGPFRLHIAPDEGLRSLPWEILHTDHDGFLSVNPTTTLTPIRRASLRAPAPRTVAARPTRIAFLAAAPLDAGPVLDFEAEEGQLLTATDGRGDVIVEESGSLAGLKTLFDWFGATLDDENVSYFDVLHLSGHARITPDGPRFVMESDTGHAVDVSAQEIADTVGGRWPGLVFLSGCHTAQAGPDGATASMAEALVAAGADAVLGWALPVGDHSASALAATLYGAIASGATIPDAVTKARRALHAAPNPHWHLLRLYSSRDVPGALVTAPGHPNYQAAPTRRASTRFLDAAGSTKVADYGAFVGRRRDLQTLLSTLRPATIGVSTALVTIIGMGGLGKSTLTARLLERLAPYGYRFAVWTGKIAPATLRDLPSQLLLDPAADKTANELLNAPDTSLDDRLRHLFQPRGPLASTPCVFVFDDFEDGNLDPDGTGNHQCTPDAREVLTALATAITGTGSPSRIIVASRYAFDLPEHVRALRWPISRLEGHELDKKLRLTDHLGPTSRFDPAIKDRAIAASAGVPRLVERLDALLATHNTADAASVLDAIEATQIEYREELLLDTLLAASPARVRRLLALLSIYEIAVPLEACLPLDPDTDLQPDLQHAVRTGLVHAGLHPRTGEQRYLVSPLVRPLLANYDEALTTEEATVTQERAAHTLYNLWINQ